MSVYSLPQVAIEHIEREQNPILNNFQILEIKLKEAHRENGLLSKRICQKKLQIRRFRENLQEKDRRISAMEAQIHSLKAELRKLRNPEG